MTSEELEEIEERCNKATPNPTLTRYDHGGGRSYVSLPSGGVDLVADYYGEGPDREFYYHSREDIPKLLSYIKELESRLPRWISITVAVPEEYEIVLFKMVELVALKGEEKPVKGSDPIPDIFESFPDIIETRTSYFTGYRMDKVYRDHLHNCVRNYARLEWVRIFKEEE